MKKIKLLIALLVITAMVFSLIGCTAKPVDSGDATPAPANPGETATPELDPSLDLTGKTFTIYNWMDLGNLTDQFFMFQPYEDAAYQFAEKTGATLKFIKGNNFNTIVAANAAGEPYDAIYNYQFHPLYPLLGLVMPIDGLFDFDDPVFSREYIDQHKWKDSHWFINNVDQLELHNLQYNKTKFAENGLEDPYDLWKAGNWNYETFTQAAIALTQDTNGDGQVDYWGMGGWLLQRNAFFTNGGQYIDILPDGTLKPMMDSQANREYFQFVYDLHTTHRVVSVRDQFAITKGIVAMQYVGSRFTPMSQAEKFLAGGDELGVVPFPYGPSANGKTRVSVNNMGWGIGNGAKNPQASALYIKMAVEATSEYLKTLEWPEQEGTIRKDGEAGAAFLEWNLYGVSLGTTEQEKFYTNAVSTVMEEMINRANTQTATYNYNYFFN